jgi:hypothetical protein
MGSIFAARRAGSQQAIAEVNDTNPRCDQYLRHQQSVERFRRRRRIAGEIEECVAIGSCRFQRSCALDNLLSITPQDPVAVRWLGLREIRPDLDKFARTQGRGSIWTDFTAVKTTAVAPTLSAIESSARAVGKGTRQKIRKASRKSCRTDIGFDCSSTPPSLRQTGGSCRLVSSRVGMDGEIRLLEGKICEPNSGQADFLRQTEFGLRGAPK